MESKNIFLCGISALIHRFQGSDDDKHPQALHLSFSEDRGATICCRTDGESIDISFGPNELEELDMGDAGRLIIKGFSKFGIFEKYLNRKLMNFFIVSANEINIGSRFILENGEFSIFNLGDKIFYLENIPDFLFEDNVEFIPLRF